MKKSKPFATEAEMCACFIAQVGETWTSYAETAGWDILLVRKIDGFQIGIEAKLRLGLAVINQVLDEYGSHTAAKPQPDCRAVLVPDGEDVGFSRIAAYIGFTIIRIAPRKDAWHGWRQESFRPALPKPDSWHSGGFDDWFATARRCRLPEYVPDVTAGASAPLQLTDWKIKAIKIAVTLERRGFVTREDFKHLQIDHRRWMPREGRWLAVENGVFVKGEAFPDFRAMHPRNYAEIDADFEKWSRKVLAA